MWAVAMVACLVIPWLDQLLRRVALAAALLVPAAVVALVGLALQATAVVTWALSVWVAGLPLAIGAAVLRYRLYDLDRIISRTLAWGCSRSCWGLATPRWCWDWASCSVATPAWSWPGPPWRSRRCSDRPAAASRRSSTAASTDADTTPPRRSRRSAPTCATSSTWTPSGPSSWRRSRRPCSQPRYRCGCDRKHLHHQEKLACRTRWGWQASNLRPGGYEPPALTD
jgi:hypothetical protein